MTDPTRGPKSFAEVLRKEAERLGCGPRQPMDPRDALLAGAEALEREQPVTKRDTPTLGEVFEKLYPSSRISPEERILLTGYACGHASKAEKDLEAERERVRNLLPYLSHMACARNGLGAAWVDCTCGLDTILAGVKS